jgi:acetylornithine/N-succinyldiaminopimelate aminotransferase
MYNEWNGGGKMVSEKIIENDKKYLIKSYAPHDIVLVKGEGCKLYDAEGREYLDFLAGIAVSVLGHNNKKLVSAITAQAKKVLLTSGYFHNENSGRLAQELVKNTHFKRVFFANSGAEANECALKIAKKYMNDNCPGRYKIVVCEKSFHGRTIATVAATGQDKYKKPFLPLPDWYIQIPFNDTEALKKALSNPEVGAFLVECIQGEGGVREASAEFIQTARKLTRRYNQLLIVDEIQTGLYRTGKQFSYMHYRIKPDIITVAKALGGGIPIGACLAGRLVEDTIRPGDHGTTFGGNPLATGVAMFVLKEIRKTKTQQHLAEIGEYFYAKLKEVADRKETVAELRGKGLMLGLNIVSGVNVKDYVKALIEEGILCTDAGGDTLRFLPPFIITKDEIDILIAKLEKVIK